MGYFSMQVGRLDEEVLRNNISTIVNRVNTGTTTIDQGRCPFCKEVVEGF